MNYGFGGSNACVILGDGGYQYKSPDCRFVRGFGNCLIMNYGFGGSNACVILGDGGYQYKSPDCRFVRGFGNSECKPSLMMQAQPWNRTMYGMRTVLDKKSGEVVAKSVAKDE